MPQAPTQVSSDPTQPIGQALPSTYLGIPAPPPAPPSRWTTRLLIGQGVLVLVLLAIIVVLLVRPLGASTNQEQSVLTTATPKGITATPSPTLGMLNEETASALMQQFYGYINARNYDAAYALLSSEWHQTQSRQSFIDGFQNTIRDTLMIDGVERLDDEYILVNIYLTAEETSYVTSYYAGYYIVTNRNAQLLILIGSLVKQ